MPYLRTDSWLVAVWPGMGGVAQIAGEYLVQQLGARELELVTPGVRATDTRSVLVQGGLVVRSDPPLGRLFEWRDPHGRRDLFVFLGERQAEHGGRAWCDAILDRALELGVGRVVTFAALASDVQPQVEPTVRVAATSASLLSELRLFGATRMSDGEIAGLNGLLIGAAGERGVPAACLLGEMPYFAVGVPNPRAARAILRVFAQAAGIPVDLAVLGASVEEFESQLARQIERMRRASEDLAEELADDLTRVVGGADAEVRPAEPALSPGVARRIEELFAEAFADRSRAIELKRYLDEHAVFGRYEDRFLDLFRPRR